MFLPALGAVRTILKAEANKYTLETYQAQDQAFVLNFSLSTKWICCRGKQERWAAMLEAGFWVRS